MKGCALTRLQKDWLGGAIKADSVVSCSRSTGSWRLSSHANASVDTRQMPTIARNFWNKVVRLGCGLVGERGQKAKGRGRELNVRGCCPALPPPRRPAETVLT